MPHLRAIAVVVLALSTGLWAQRPGRAPERTRALDEVTEAHPRLGPPKRLLGTQFKWQAQSGAWKADAEAGTLSGVSDGTLAEYGAANGVKLSGHWLLLNATLSGNAAKAGVWFAGVRDGRGEVLRFALDSAGGGIVDGRGQAIAGLPAGAFARPVEIVLNFSTDKVTLHYAGRQLAEIAVTFEEPQATPSLFVERGEASFSELLLSGDPAVPVAQATPAVVPAPVGGNAEAPMPVPAPGRPGAAVAAAPAGPWAVDLAPEKMTAMKSGWNEYFGVHFETGAGPWKMVRQFDGPEFGIPGQGRHTGEVKQFPGPFAQVPVDMALADFRDWRRKEARGLDENLTALVKDDRQGLFITPWAGPIGKVEQDQIYALMKLAYGANPGAEGRLFFQWGDSVNDSHYGTPGSSRRHIMSAPSGSTRLGRGANTAADLTAYAENYLAPAVEAVRLASEEIFKDPRRIPIVAGSCGASGEPENRGWYGQLFDRVLEGTAAPSLKGRKLASLVDYLAVNYPLAGAENDAPLQEIWDRFCVPVAKPGEAVLEQELRPRGLWVTEEYGVGARGAATLLTRAARFLAWAARNDLDARQTRLLWNIPAHARGSDEALAVVRSLGEGIGVAPLRLGIQDMGDGRLIRIAAGEGRILLVYYPVTIRRGRRPVAIGEVAIAMTEAQAARPWVAREYQELGRKPGAEPAAAQPVRRDGVKLFVNVTANAQEPWVVLVETP
jgi:hypothetical protein